MTTFKIGDFVYIPPFDNNIVYDKNKPTYEIVDIIKEEVWEQQGYGNATYEPVVKYRYLVNVYGEIKEFNEVKGLPNLDINNININEFKIDDKTIHKIEKNEGKWEWREHGKSPSPEYPNRHKYTLSDGSIVESSDYAIVNKLGGKRMKTRKNKKSKKTKKFLRKSKRRR